MIPQVDLARATDKRVLIWVDLYQSEIYVFFNKFDYVKMLLIPRSVQTFNASWYDPRRNLSTGTFDVGDFNGTPIYVSANHVNYTIYLK